MKEEGIVIKALDSPWKSNERRTSWLKWGGGGAGGGNMQEPGLFAGLSPDPLECCVSLLPCLAAALVRRGRGTQCQSSLRVAGLICL